jgi:hypothetical protein
MAPRILWMILLLVQTTLISTGQIKMHRRLGMITFGLAVLMVVLGVLSGIDAMGRGVAPLGLDAQTFAVISLSDMVCFSALVLFAYRTRFQAELHKRHPDLFFRSDGSRSRTMADPFSAGTPAGADSRPCCHSVNRCRLRFVSIASAQ